MSDFNHSSLTSNESKIKTNADYDTESKKCKNIEKAVSENEVSFEDHIELKDSIEVSKLCSEQGTIFEVVDMCQENKDNISNSIGSLNYDNLFANMSLGTNYAGISNSSDTDDDLEPFEKLAKHMDDISGDGGVLKEVLFPGVGSDLPEGMTVTFHYNAYFEYADEPFDSTYLRNKPQRCTLKDASVVVGLKVGLKTMRNKEKARFLVKPSYAFGSMGCPPRIPGDATVLFDVTILNAVDHSAADDFENLDDEHRRRAPFIEKLEAAKAYHRKANASYRAANYLKAKDDYRRALSTIDHCYVKNEEESKQQCEMMARLYSNLAQVNLDLKLPAKACTDCKHALDVPIELPNDKKVKLYFRFAKAKMMLDDFKTSHAYLKKSQKLKPNNHDIAKLLEELCVKELKYKEREKVMCQGMFSCYRKDSAACITQAAQDESNESGLLNENSSLTLVDVDMSALDNVSTQNKSSVLPNIRSEFKEAVIDQLEHFILNESVKELTLPSNLNTEEMAYIFAAAKAADLSIEKLFVGSRSLLKLRK